MVNAVRPAQQVANSDGGSDDRHLLLKGQSGDGGGNSERGATGATTGKRQSIGSADANVGTCNSNNDNDNFYNIDNEDDESTRQFLTNTAQQIDSNSSGSGNNEKNERHDPYLLPKKNLELVHKRIMMLAKRDSVISGADAAAAAAAATDDDTAMRTKRRRQRGADAEAGEQGDSDHNSKHHYNNNNNSNSKNHKSDSSQAGGCCCGMSMRLVCLLLLPLALICCIIVVYCVPLIEIDARAPTHSPVSIPFNFEDGPLQATNPDMVKIQKMFAGQVHGPESMAIDSQGNMYMAISGGFILYAHLNKSSPRRRSYYEYYVRASSLAASSPTSGAYQQLQQQQQQQPSALLVDPAQQRVPVPTDLPDLVKIAELNGIKQLPHNANIAPDGTNYSPANSYSYHTNQPNNRDRARRQQRQQATGASFSWRRECQLDEQLYGNQLYSPPPVPIGVPLEEVLEMTKEPFVSHVPLSRCSQPLGIRLSPDERHLYVIDTISGLYRVNLKVPEKPQSAQRLVTKLIDFRANHGLQYLPILQYAGPQPAETAPMTTTTTTKPATTDHPYAPDASVPVARASQVYLNVTLKAIDDLVIDYGAGASGGDLIYLSLASQLWAAHSFVYDMMEMRPSGVVLRYDTGSGQLAVLDPTRLSYVRLSSQIELNDDDQGGGGGGGGGARPTGANGTDYIASPPQTGAPQDDKGAHLAHLLHGYGAPQFNENDIFDDRPLHFVNGLELTDDKEALLIADSLNNRIVKHYIRGPRVGTSDLWAWTPLIPDNIRRGVDRRHETYWVIGCGGDPSDQLMDTMHLLDNWPRVRKYLLKNMYLVGWVLERLGAALFQSAWLRDLGYTIKDGSYFMEPFCQGMMLVQYNKHGDIIRSVHSNQFPSDQKLFSQANEVVDAQREEHSLYLGSPINDFVTKLTLPSGGGR